MGFDMLLQILRSLEGFATEITFVWFQGDMNPDVRGNVITLDGCRTATTPGTSEIEIVG